MNEKDMVEVVRCKDCFFWDKDSEGLTDEHVCRMHSNGYAYGRYTGPEDFCSYGEQRPKITRYQRILSMDIDEMAEWICDMYRCDGCIAEDYCNGTDGKANGMKKWLESEAEE